MHRRCSGRWSLSRRVQIALPAAMALIVTVAGSISWSWWREIRTSLAAHNTQPILDKGQLSALPTYKRHCRTQADCEDPLLCTSDPRVSGWRCLASECETDHQCEPGFMCTPLIHDTTKLIHLCLIQGTRREGQSCQQFHMKEQWGCEPGLICDHGYCGRPCDPHVPSACPEGFFCHGDTRLPTCLPSCLRSGCPQGRQCIRLNGDFSICATVHGQNCDKQPCPQGEECQRALDPRPWSQVVNMWCAPACNEQEGRTCPAGSVCLNNRYCARLCDEGAPETCAPGERCTKMFTPGKTFAACLMSQ